MILTVLFAIYLTAAISAASYEIYIVHLPIIDKEFFHKEKISNQYFDEDFYKKEINKEMETTNVK